MITFTKQCICINDKNPVSQEQTLFRKGTIYGYEFMTEGIYKDEYVLSINTMGLPPDMFNHYMMDLQEYREKLLNNLTD
jgi:hypothetical protein